MLRVICGSSSGRDMALRLVLDISRTSCETDAGGVCSLVGILSTLFSGEATSGGPGTIRVECTRSGSLSCSGRGCITLGRFGGRASKGTADESSFARSCPPSTKSMTVLTTGAGALAGRGRPRTLLCTTGSSLLDTTEPAMLPGPRRLSLVTISSSVE